MTNVAQQTQKSRRLAAKSGVNSRSFANAAVGLIGGGVGAAAAAATLPLVGAIAVVGGLTGFLLTNRIPKD